MTAPVPAPEPATVEVYREVDCWWWRKISPTGEIVAHSDRGFATEVEAERYAAAEITLPPVMEP